MRTDDFDDFHRGRRCHLHSWGSAGLGTERERGKNERENGGAVKLWDESLGGCLLMA
jgi:hypothetical protein